MAPRFQISFDASSPRALGAFWALALEGYEEQPPPEGFDSWEAFLDAQGVPPDRRDSAWAVVDPDGVGPRLYFQQAPEGKTAKNRVHLDVDCGGGPSVPRDERLRRIEARAAELVELRARRVGTKDELGSVWVVMQDPEGNEFCLQ